MKKEAAVGAADFRAETTAHPRRPQPASAAEIQRFLWVD